ncbi:rRNA methyltransferase, TrmH family protein [Oleispira antarctica RB-8]|uniref:tRNA (cytidine/uridine-2'-O-)-methyltransferase TrmJ n=1 Tax=Oleispira antarctica RB-8 TaxID=698738 RepID=R4YQ95_OLEAN|nr:rRNA methyltransferase, TrmH family protein [Oleispira antarctica RB-8]
MNSSNNILDSIRIVLVQTYHPGNIGAIARAMKTMGLNELYLVDPREYPADEASSRAAGALDVLDNAIVVESLTEAIADCTQVFATSARKRNYTRPQVSAEEAAGWIKANPNEKIAIVFGRERMGLSNEQLGLCQQLLYIPGNPEYDVLNIGSAVQIVSYELFKQFGLHRDDLVSTTETSSIEASAESEEYASQQDMERFYQHLESTLSDTGFLVKNHPGEAILRLQQMFARAQPNAKELRMLRGILGSVDKLTNKT